MSGKTYTKNAGSEKNQAVLLRRREACRQWSLRNKEYLRFKAAYRWRTQKKKLAKQYRKWAVKNRQYRNEYSRKLYRNRPDLRRKRSEANKAWVKKNIERVRQSRRKYAQKNRLKIKKRMKVYSQAYYILNRQTILNKTHEYSKSHPEIRRKCHKNWCRSHPEKYKAHNKAGSLAHKARKRMAHVGDVEINSTIKTWRLRKNFRCNYCSKVFPTKRMTIDHIIPISKGGKHCVDNICKSCGPCNGQKRDIVLFKSGEVMRFIRA